MSDSTKVKRPVNEFTEKKLLYLTFDVNIEIDTGKTFQIDVALEKVLGIGQLEYSRVYFLGLFLNVVEQSNK